MREAGFLPNITLNVKIAAAPVFEEDSAEVYEDEEDSAEVYENEDEEIASDSNMEEDHDSEEESDEDDDIVSTVK